MTRGWTFTIGLVWVLCLLYAYMVRRQIGEGYSWDTIVASLYAFVFVGIPFLGVLYIVTKLSRVALGKEKFTLH